LLALFFDMSSMQPQEQVRAIDSAEKFIREQMTASDLVSIMTFGTKFKVVQEFTDNRDLLLDLIRKFAAGEGSELAGEATTGPDEEDDSGAFTADDTEFNIFNTDRKLSALEQAAKKLGVFPEKKALIYFSSGVGKTGTENQSQLKATVNAAVRANVSFYPVDARGLMATAPGGDASTASPRGTGIFSGRSQQQIRTRVNDQQETLFSLASDTGGRAMLDSNDLGQGIVQAQKDISSYYIIGYYSTNEAQDGKFRRINIKLNNPALNAKLDYRQGYFASKVWTKFSAGDKERQLEDALALGDPVSELPMALEVDYFRVASGRYFVPLSVKIPGAAIELAKKGQREQTQLDFIGEIRDKAGKQVAAVRDSIPVKLTEVDAAKLAQRNLHYDAGLTLGPGDYTVRFVARENLGGKMGTFETRFTVPDLNQSGKQLRLSSVIWSNQREKLEAAVGSADSNKRLLAQHPLVHDGQKIVPSITRVFRKDQNLIVYFEVYDPTLDPERKAPSVSAELALYAGARKVVAVPLRKNELAKNRPGVIPFEFSVALARLNPGSYTAQVSAIDEQGRKFAFPRASLVVLGEQAAKTP
jgi:VWFA-related protein